MAKSFNELRERLLRAGVAPRHVRRYLTELSDHLADLREEEVLAGRSPADAESAALVRLGGIDVLSKAMIDQRQFQSWCVRAPWAIFGLVPLFFLAGAYFVACLILWSGWKIYLPGTDTPFVRIHGFAIVYFGAGRWIYYASPILVGWGIGLIAARQRFKAVWPAVGLVLISLIGGAFHVHATRPVVPGGVGQISMHLSLGPPIPGLSHLISCSLIQGLAILTLTALPTLLAAFAINRSARRSRAQDRLGLTSS